VEEIVQICKDLSWCSCIKVACTCLGRMCTGSDTAK